MDTPALISSLDKDRRISSKWIAQECDKQHKHVIRDIQEKFGDFQGPNPDRTVIHRKNGQIQEVLLSLTKTLVLMSGYGGEKAAQSRSIVEMAVDYFINRAPQLEQELREMKEKLGWVQKRYKRDVQKELPGSPSSVSIRVRGEVLPGFPPPDYVTIKVSPEEAQKRPDAVILAELTHVKKVLVGVTKKHDTLEGYIFGVTT